MAKCQEQYKVYVSFAEFHIPHIILSKLVPMEAVSKSAACAQSIRDGHNKANEDAKKVADVANRMDAVFKVRGLLSRVKTCASSTSIETGTTEQAHSLKNAPRDAQRSGTFKEGTSPPSPSL